MTPVSRSCATTAKTATLSEAPRFGIAVADRDIATGTDDSGIAIARRVDASSVDSLWTNETGGADAFVTLGAWAAVTDRVRLATGVVPLAARATRTLALAASQVSQLSSGRFMLGIGVGQRGMAENHYERQWRPPLEWVRDAIAAFGEEAAGARIGAGYRVLVGALGPKMLALGATAAEGALLNWTTVESQRVARAEFDRTAAAAGRDPESLTLAGYVRVAVGPDAESALSKQSRFYSSMPFYREAWQAMGDPADDAVALASPDGRDLRERLLAWDALDVAVARIVPTPEFPVERVVDILCDE